MKAQFKYAFRQGLGLRCTMLALTVAINLTFAILGTFKLWGQPGMIVGIVFSSLTLCAVFIVNIIADNDSLKFIFSSPEGYLSALTPVSGKKILLARLVTLACEDILLLSISIAGVVYNSITLGSALGVFAEYRSWLAPAVIQFLSATIGYFYLVMLIVLYMALKKSLFYSTKAGGLLALATTALCAWVLSFSNFATMPFGLTQRFGYFFNITLYPGFNAGTFVYMLMGLCRIAALFFAAAYLLDRKVNL